ncbi:MAG: helix-turn-helix transcriptional regulator [Bacteroidota bacterium]
MTYGELVRKHRMGKALTLKDLAQEMSCSVAYVCDIEHGRKLPPGLDKGKALARLLDLSPAEQEELEELRQRARQQWKFSAKGRPHDHLRFMANLAQAWDSNALTEEQVQQMIEILNPSL